MSEIDIIKTSTCTFYTFRRIEIIPTPSLFSKTAVKQ